MAAANPNRGILRLFWAIFGALIVVAVVVSRTTGDSTYSAETTVPTVSKQRDEVAPEPTTSAPAPVTPEPAAPEPKKEPTVTRAVADDLSGRSPQCGPIKADSPEALEQIKLFCSLTAAKGLMEGAFTHSGALVVFVDGPVARALLSDRLGFEDLMRTWLRAWRTITETRSVWVEVRWGEIELAKALGNRVTIKNP